jgi:hypothetical protein
MIFTSIIALLLLSSPAPAAEKSSLEGMSVSPAGGLSKGSSVTLEPADPSKTYFESSLSKTGNFDTMDAKSLYNVKFSPPVGPLTSEDHELQGLANMNKLLIQDVDLRQHSPNCVLSSAKTTCILQNDVPVFTSGLFDIKSYMLSKLGSLGRKSAHATEPSDQNRDHEIVEAMGTTLKRVHSTVSGNQKSIIKDCDEKNRAFNLGPKSDEATHCGIQQAIQAYQENKHRIKKDIIVFNDFGRGQLTGNMWFLNTDGTPAKVLSENPIPVARGVGGFGTLHTSNKTPDGALLTNAYNPPRPGNVKDGIELEGLEAENKNSKDPRGILIHGWNSNAPTHGCLGVAGTLNTKTRGKRVLGTSPPFLDELKKTLFQDGGVLIYNFTPKKKDLCK